MCGGRLKSFIFNNKSTISRALRFLFESFQIFRIFYYIYGNNFVYQSTPRNMNLKNIPTELKLKYVDLTNLVQLN